MGDLDATSSGEVPVEVELLLEFERLISSVGSALSLGLAHRVDAILADVDLAHPRVDMWRVAAARVEVAALALTVHYTAV